MATIDFRLLDELGGEAAPILTRERRRWWAHRERCAPFCYGDCRSMWDCAQRLSGLDGRDDAECLSARRAAEAALLEPLRPEVAGDDG